MSTITRTVCIRSHRQTRFKLSSSSSKSCSQSSFITHPCWAITTPRHASTFVPGVTPIDQIPPLPKPHSTNWFTTHPALSDSFSKFDSLIHRSRQNLYRLGILKRYASPADFTGTGVRSKWLKWKMEQDRELDSSKLTPEDHQLFNVLWSQQIKWHPLPTMAILLQSNEFRPLKMIEYNHAIKRLNELKGLKKYLMIAKSLQLTNEPEINELDSEIEEILLKYTKPEDKAQIIKTQEIERDHLGRFYGLGRKKESTARVWMIEVKIPESAIETQPPTLINSSVDSSADSSAKESDDQPESIQSQPTTEPSDEQLITSSHDLPLGKIIINGRSIVDYFHTPRQRATAIRPLEITNCMGHYNIHILTHGGGKMGQAAAISHAISQALMKALTEAGRTDGTAQERYAKKVLVKSRLSLRDPRVVERKKTGKPGAKSSYRWVKR